MKSDMFIFFHNKMENKVPEHSLKLERCLFSLFSHENKESLFVCLVCSGRKKNIRFLPQTYRLLL